MSFFRLGINYWPIRTAMAMWKRFDAGEIAEDQARIADAGFDSVRVFLLWEDFQPGPCRVSVDMLDRLVRVADAARAAGLGLMPTLFTGHMSGVNWIPAWALTPGSRAGRFRTVSGGQVVAAVGRNWYVDSEISRAQARLAREVAEALSGHPALWAIDLGNEPSNCVQPPTAEDGVWWLRAMKAALRGERVQAPVTLGLHQEDLEEWRRLSPSEACRVLDFTCIHGYPAYARWSRHPVDDGVPLFLGLLARWLSEQDVLLAELGTPTRRADLVRLDASGLVDEEAAAVFTRRALETLHQNGFLGALLWCFGDYDLSLRNQPPFDQAPHEMCFGLWRADWSPKPAVRVVEAFGRRERLPASPRLDWIDIAPAQYWRDPRRHVARLYRSFTRRHAHTAMRSEARGAAVEGVGP